MLLIFVTNDWLNDKEILYELYTMRTIFAEYNPHRNSIDIYTSAGYMLRIDCWETEKDLKTTPGSDCALNALAIDKPLEYAKLYLDETMQIWVDAEDSLELWWFFQQH